MSMPDAPSIKTVDVKSSWASKINWTQAVAFLAMMLAYFGIDLPPETQAAMVTAIGGIAAVVTWVMRTWFTQSVTKASANKGM